MDTSLSMRLRANLDLLRAVWPDCNSEDVTATDHFYTDGATDGCTLKICFSKFKTHVTSIYIKEDGSYISPWNTHKEISEQVGIWIKKIKQQSTSACKQGSSS